MKLTKEQVFRLYTFLLTLVADDTDIKVIKFIGGDIIVRAEPIRGEIENRAWKITPQGDVEDELSFFHD